MKIETGYLYHIKDEFFKKVNDDSLMSNHELGKTRPTYFPIKDGDILWFIPLSSKIEKYEAIIEKKIRKYGYCNTIYIRRILNKDAAILFQNAFPTLEKYIDHVHTLNGAPVRIADDLKEEIIDNFINLLKLNKRGFKVFFTNIDYIKEKMLDELKIN